jgi:uncharacterized damage-inducible protein DinB
MEKNYFEVLGKYNKGTNAKMNNIIKTLSEEEWDKGFSGFYKSIHELCSHIFIADYTWLNRFGILNIFKDSKGEYFNKNYNFQETLFGDIKEYLEKRFELDDIILDFIDRIMTDDLNRKIKWTNSKGETYEKKLEICLMHLFNHETHHRAMVSLYLEMMGKANDYSMLYQYG